MAGEELPFLLSSLSLLPLLSHLHLRALAGHEQVFINDSYILLPLFSNTIVHMDRGSGTRQRRRQTS